MLVALSLAPEYRRGHGAVYDAVNYGRIQIARLRRAWPGCRYHLGRRAAQARGGRQQLAAPGRGDQPGPVVLPLFNGGGKGTRR